MSCFCVMISIVFVVWFSPLYTLYCVDLDGLGTVLCYYLLWYPAVVSFLMSTDKRLLKMSLSSTNDAAMCMMLEDIMWVYRVEMTVLIYRYMNARTRRKRRRIFEHARRFSVLTKIPIQLQRLDRLIHYSNADCISNLRMDRNTFGRLCAILRARGGLTIGKCIGIEEQVAIFLSVLAHHKKNRVLRTAFWRAGGTVSYYVHRVLCAVLSLHSVLLSKSTPVREDCTDNRWKWFKVWTLCFMASIVQFIFPSCYFEDGFSKSVSNSPFCHALAFLGVFRCAWWNVHQCISSQCWQA